MNFDRTRDAELRQAAFLHLEKLVRTHGPVLEWQHIHEGFLYHGQKIFFANRARGIFKPKELDGPALSIKSVETREYRSKRYDDNLTVDGRFLYHFQGSDPDANDNRILRGAAEEAVPVILFQGVAPGKYRPLWPVFIQEPDLIEKRCKVDLSHALLGEPELEQYRRDPDTDLPVEPEPDPARRYMISQIQRRLHQPIFRQNVLDAYEKRCAVCAIDRPPLLEAAHIVPDSQGGQPTVKNGLSLCLLHHGALDRHMMTVRPDLTVEVGAVLLEPAGPPAHQAMFHAFRDKRIWVPRQQDCRPDFKALEQRYRDFQRANA